MKMKDNEPSVGFTLDRRSLLRSSMLMGGALAVQALSADAAFTAAATNSPVATTKAGMVRGKLEDGINVFKGIPYGAPPTGSLRFMAPVRPAPWTGVRDAFEFGDQCPQVPPPPTPEWRSWMVQTGESEDCLVLNVWTPALRDGRKRPVMVWFHGGGYSVFNGSASVYDGVRLCKKGDVVLVTLNHRLNAFGYLYLGELGGATFADSGNVGQLDLVLALEWVRDNIQEFGGDPEQRDDLWGIWRRWKGLSNIGHARGEGAIPSSRNSKRSGASRNNARSSDENGQKFHGSLATPARSG